MFSLVLTAFWWFSVATVACVKKYSTCVFSTPQHLKSNSFVKLVWLRKSPRHTKAQTYDICATLCQWAHIAIQEVKAPGGAHVDKTVFTILAYLLASRGVFLACQRAHFLFYSLPFSHSSLLFGITGRRSGLSTGAPSCHSRVMSMGIDTLLTNF